ncbi:hypothetical protein T11_6939 [Trichinella zimbabwensis]|uniref:Uncharacterized protein n=1 Tax=Trichinella zimbabwensis TaxID=268475 RepID=A0A0V1I1B2_9BILA|nr:hypothetical protein T11_6939 [Trichinella zimbabwensis]
MEKLFFSTTLYHKNEQKSTRVYQSTRTFEQVTEKDSVGRTIKPTVRLLDSGFVGPVETQRPLTQVYPVIALAEISHVQQLSDVVNRMPFGSRCGMLAELCHLNGNAPDIPLIFFILGQRNRRNGKLPDRSTNLSIQYSRPEMNLRRPAACQTVPE